MQKEYAKKETDQQNEEISVIRNPHLPRGSNAENFLHTTSMQKQINN